MTTGSFGSVTAEGLTIGWDTDAPRPDAPADPGERVIVDGMSASWAIDVLPPVANPQTVAFKVYQSSPDALGTWLPWPIGTPISVIAESYDADLGSLRLWTFKGRVADISGANHPSGGILFSLVCTDRLADLASANSPAELVPSSSQSDLAPGLFDVYQQLADDADIDFDWQAGAGFSLPYWWELVSSIDMTNTTTLDALSLAITHDLRPNADPNVEPTVHNVDRWLTQQVDTGSTDPEATARYRLNEWDPEGVDDLAGVAAFHWTGSVWTVITSTSYSGSGMVLDADQLARDVGDWRQTRDQAVNTIELTSAQTFDTGAKTTRAQFQDLVDAYGRNTRSMPCWYADRDDARAWGYELLIRRDQVQVDGFGFTQLLVAWETLTSDQLVLWGDELFPHFAVPVLGRAFAVVNIPDDWKLAPGQVVVGRLMGVTMTLQDGRVRAQLTTRAVPPSAVNGVTFDDVAAFSPVQMTLDNIDPQVTIDQLAVVGPTTE